MMATGNQPLPARKRTRGRIAGRIVPLSRGWNSLILPGLAARRWPCVVRGRVENPSLPACAGSPAMLLPALSGRKTRAS